MGGLMSYMGEMWVRELQLCVGELVPWVPCTGGIICVRELSQVPCIRGMVPCMRQLVRALQLCVGELVLCMGELVPWVPCMGGLLCVRDLKRVPCTRGLVPCVSRQCPEWEGWCSGLVPQNP